MFAPNDFSSLTVNDGGSLRRLKATKNSKYDVFYFEKIEYYFHVGSAVNGHGLPAER